jgi:hypothetical protein
MGVLIDGAMQHAAHIARQTGGIDVDGEEVDRAKAIKQKQGWRMGLACQERAGYNLTLHFARNF